MTAETNATATFPSTAAPREVRDGIDKAMSRLQRAEVRARERFAEDVARRGTASTVASMAGWELVVLEAAIKYVSTAQTIAAGQVAGKTFEQYLQTLAGFLVSQTTQGVHGSTFGPATLVAQAEAAGLAKAIDELTEASWR